jgi:hypothetical protein
MIMERAHESTGDGPQHEPGESRRFETLKVTLEFQQQLQLAQRNWGAARISMAAFECSESWHLPKNWLRCLWHWT